MTERPIAVLGGGNGAHMMAADLTSRGHKVCFYEHPQFEERFRTVLETGVITAKGIGPCGSFRLHQVSTDMGATLENVEWVNLAIPATGHDLFFQEMMPHLKSGQKVVVWAGDFGSFRLRKLLAKSGKNRDITVIEANTLPYGARREGPGKVDLLCIAPRVMVAALPSSKLAKVFGELKGIFPCVIEGKHVLAAAFNNPNPMVHPPGSLLNTGRIEYSKGDFYMYREGITEAVARVIREVYDESRRVANAFGFDMIEYRDVDFTTTTSIMGVEFVAPFDTRGVIASILGPASLRDRYITEDLPMGLVPRSELGRVVGVPTPVIDGIVSIGSVICKEDFWQTGRTLETLGISGMSRDDIVKVVTA